jgi:hypothetical protein
MSTLRTLTLLVLIGLIPIAPSNPQSSYPYAVNTVAGTSALGDGGPATSALLEFPQAAVADSAGNIYIGNCPAGVQPGDRVNSDGTVIHLGKK